LMVVTSKLKSIDYGKSRVRVAKIERRLDHHEFCEFTIALRLAGPFEDCFLNGNNSMIVPTDTMKNTVYAIASQTTLAPAERFAMKLGRHFLDTHAHVTGVGLDIVEHRWNRLDPFTFEQGQSQRLAMVEMTRDSLGIHAGIDNLLVLKTTKSSFVGYLKDQYTTLKETSDRIMATSVRAVWRYDSFDLDFEATMASCRKIMIDVFAAHDSLAVQQTLYAMGDAVLKAHPEIGEIRITLPNKHYLPVNLEALGLENKNEVFLPTDEPHGLIEACITR
jgi:urate oxidase